MESTMQDFPLTVTGILRHGTLWYSGRKVITKTPDGYREITFGELGTRVAQLAHGLRDIGIANGDRVATFMWNNQEHLEAYFAAPCMGAVLHTLNIASPANRSPSSPTRPRIALCWWTRRWHHCSPRYCRIWRPCGPWWRSVQAIWMHSPPPARR